MTIRHSLQVKGITHPHPSVVNATKLLVDKLATLDPEVAIGMVILERNPLHARYIAARTGEVLAEIQIDDD
jgi:hypothetical protein